MKGLRQNAIFETILAQDIETQNELIEALRKRGIESTQATISRDIKELQLVKELTQEGKYRYAPAKRRDVQDHASRLKAIFRESVTSIVCAQNIVVLKTLPGLAPAACSAIDGMNINEIAGTLAGDDTAFLAMYTIEAAARFCKEIEEML